jgi:hypothetical protein
MDLGNRDFLKVSVAVATLGFSAWAAYTGYHANLIRIQSTFFPVSGVAFLLMVLGLIGAVSSVAIFGFPRSAGIVASLTMIAMSVLGIYHMFARYRIEVLVFIAVWIIVPLTLAIVVAKLFCFDRDQFW